MSDIWNLNALCRCCHSDGIFKSLQLPYIIDNNVEIYSVMLQETIGVNIKPPPMDASYSICDECIKHLRNTLKFKKKVLECEKKFEEYCKNEQAMFPSSEVKIEVGSYGSDHGDSDHDATPLLNDPDDYKADDKRKLKLNPHEDIAHGGQYVEIKVNIIDDKIAVGDVGEVKVEDFNDNKIEIKIDGIKSKRKPVKELTIASKKRVRSERIKTQMSEESLKKIDLTQIEYLNTVKGDLFKCKVCEVSFKKETYIKRHLLEEHTIPKQYKCDHCPKEFSKDTKLRAHLRLHGVKNFDCKYCNKKYSSHSLLMEHMNIHTKAKVFTCQFCNKSFLYKQILRRHIRLHLGTSKTHMCDICGNSFNDKTQVAIHIRTVHEKVRQYSCDICNKSYAANKTLKVHYRTHTGETPYKCDKCPQQFISSTLLKRHKFDHGPQGVPAARYRCKVCRKVFFERGKFASHVRKHAGEKPFVCTLCNKDFTCKYTLKRHTEEHYGIKAFSCEICHAKFSQKVQLVRHNDRFHNPDKVKGEKRRCELCKRSVYNWEKHLKTHDRKPFACGHCNKRYAEKNGLNRHVKIVHEGIKPHQCFFCDKKYAKASSLKNHIEKAHKIEMKTEDNETYLPKFTITKIESLE